MTDPLFHFKNYHPRQLEIIDTTLREGSQSSLLHDHYKYFFSQRDKIELTEALIIYGVKFIELFSPIVSPQEKKDFKAIKAVRDALIAQKGYTYLLAHVRCHPDDVAAAIEAGFDGLNFYIGTSEMSRRYNHGNSLDRIINIAVLLLEQVRRDYPHLILRFSGEDAFRTPLEDLFYVYDAVAPLVDRFGTPDTVGVATPEAVQARVKALRKRYPQVDLEGHFHEDRGYATLNALAASKEGLRYLQTTLLGIGERSGITSLTSLFFNLYIEREYDLLEGYHLRGSYPINVMMADKLKKLVPSKEPVSLTNRTHMAGVHQKAVLNDSSVYEAHPLDVFGVTESEVLLGPLSGWNVVHYYLREIKGYQIDENTARQVAAVFKERVYRVNSEESPSRLLLELAENEFGLSHLSIPSRFQGSIVQVMTPSNDNALSNNNETVLASTKSVSEKDATSSLNDAPSQAEQPIGKTFVEKLLAHNAGLASVISGQVIEATPDVALSHDNTAPIRQIFYSLGVDKVKYPNRLAITLDHAAPPPTTRHAQNHDEIRQFVVEQGITNFYEVGRGICHQVLCEEGLIQPGTLLLGADSHATHYGALGAFGAGVGRSEMAAIWATGQLWLRVPESIKITLTGQLDPWVTSKDITIYVIGELGADGGLYASVEFHGTGIVSMSMDSRFVLSNMMAEMGAKNSWVAPDETTFQWLDAARVDEFRQLAAQFAPDPRAAYLAEHQFHLADIEPQISCPHTVDNVAPLSQVAGTKVQQAFIGTCTNGRLEDIAAAAQVVQGRHIASGTRLLIIPASSKVMLEATRQGYVETLIEAGATFGPPGCGPCMGNHLGIPAPKEVTISSANRNFKGRMGTPDTEIYLASPAVVAASAVAGVIKHPGDVVG